MTGIISKYKVNKFPKIMAIGVDKKIKFYEGEDIRYKPIFDFCNIYQETFFVVGSDSAGNIPAPQPWMNEKFPELTKESVNDLCLKVEGAICVLLINKEKPDAKLEAVIDSIQNWLSPKINRGIKYKFGWVSSTKQNGIISAMKLTKNSGPTLALVNPGKRKRYHIYDGEFTENELQKIFDKLNSGEIRFESFKDNKIPEFEQ